jgi:hypothetical protein
MKLIISFFITGLILVLLITGEDKANDCGMGLNDKLIHDGLTIDWFNGGPRLESYDKLGVLYPGWTLQSVEGSPLFEVIRIVKYRVSSEFVQVGVIGTDGIAYKLDLKAPLFEPRIFNEKDYSVEEDDGWVYVAPENCFWGRWDVLRLLIVILIVINSAYLIKMSLRTK